MIHGAAYRLEQRARLAIVTAHTTAGLVRYPRNKRLPPLDRLMPKPRDTRRQQTPGQVAAAMRDWAASGRKHGLAIKMSRLAEPIDMKNPPVLRG